MKVDFSLIRYRKPRETLGGKPLTNLIGFDSEAYITGKPFLFCTSEGDTWGFKHLPAAFFSRKYRGSDFIVYNLKYESGAILYHLPARILRKLRSKTSIRHKGYSYKYYPHKYLSISKGKNSVRFWDLLPYFKCSLNIAAWKYLQKHKLEMNPKLFTPEYVWEHFDEIVEYCKFDATLTRDLSKWLLGQWSKHGFQPSTLYSQGSVSFRYIKEKAGIVDVWHFWLRHRESLQYACNSYWGGKFDVTSRGKFNGISYDIDSAYPHEIANLKDIREAGVIKATTYLPDADYCFMNVRVKIPSGLPHPVVYGMKSIRLYPVGEWNTYVTKSEYEYLINNGAAVKLIDGYFVYCTRQGYPYREVMKNLWTIKSDKKLHDETYRNNAKLFMNSFYGKSVQLTPQPDGELRAGPGWNPLYGAIITANCRVRLSQAQLDLGSSSLAVHTDGIISTKPLPSRYVKSGMGEFGIKRQGDGIIIACGIYQHEGFCADRGFHLSKDFQWGKLLTEMGHRSTIKIPETRALSWLAAIHQDKPEEINLFKEIHKVFDVNCDTKRLWFKSATAYSLLQGLQTSAPRIIMG